MCDQSADGLFPHFRPSPKHARVILGIPDPEGPVDEADEISPENSMMVSHVFLPFKDKEPGVNEQSEIRAASFVGAKAMIDTASRFIYGQMRLQYDTLGGMEMYRKWLRAKDRSSPRQTT